MIDVAAYRIHNWCDTSKAEPTPIFGVQAKLKGKRGWVHVAESGNALIRRQKQDAQDWIAAHPTGPTAGRLATGHGLPFLDVASTAQPPTGAPDHA